jgi:ubiquinone/menaquinone biosynthesis C-methylase UbiE
LSSEAKLVELQQALYASKNATRRWLHTSRRDWIIGAIQRYGYGKPQRALEIGPGSGVYLPVLASHFREVIAADVEEAYLKHARSLVGTGANVSFVVDDITCSRLCERDFDLIVCSEVVEHIADSEKAFATMHRLLKPGGILIVSTPQRYSPLELAAKIAFLPGIIGLVRLIYREPILETGHINLMTENQVVGQLRAAGFKILEQFKSGVYVPFLAEFAGVAGLRIEQWLEPRLRRGHLAWVLWTQYFIAQA